MDLRLVPVRVGECDLMSGMSSMGVCPAPGRSCGKILFGRRTAFADDGPGPHVVGIVTGVPFVIHGKLLEGSIPRLELFEFVIEIPRMIAAGT